ncbi:MAG TPA: poly(3-hydroxyalkanoate) depolymerase [Casimicrobiaceae bacterium]|nr:poly(3-hydroxyalkanoate) depolymerase [Casimicrobiaceae bacterium]
MDDASEFAVRCVDVGSQRLRVGIKRGEHRSPPLVVFNGIGANLELLEGVARTLQGIEVIAFDVPGIGGSPPPRSPYRFKALARLTAAMLDELGYRDAVDVLGVSWGGALAQQFARTCAHRCRRLVLAATTAGALMVPGRLGALLTLMSPRRYSDPAFLLRVAPLLYGGRVAEQPGLVAPFARRMLRPDPRGYLLQQLALAGWTSVPWLRRLEQPTLIVAGTRDPLIHVANAKLMHRLIPNSRLALVDDGHLFLLTDREAVAETVLRFLRADDPLREFGRVAATGRAVARPGMAI